MQASQVRKSERIITNEQYQPNLALGVSMRYVWERLKNKPILWES